MNLASLAVLATLAMMGTGAHEFLATDEVIPEFLESAQAGSAPALSVAYGPCQVASDGCVTSSHYPASYGDNENCNIEVAQTGLVTATSFSTERCCDKLTVGSTEYQGRTGPVNANVTAGDLIHWRSDFSVTQAGWKLCFDSSVVPAPPPLPFTQGLWTLHSGKCEVESDCIRSPNFPRGYGNNQQCSFTALGPGFLSVGTRFNTEACCDELTVTSDGVPTRFAGLHGPTNLALNTGDTVSWHSDFSITSSSISGGQGGWEVCLAAASSGSGSIGLLPGLGFTSGSGLELGSIGASGSGTELLDAIEGFDLA